MRKELAYVRNRTRILTSNCEAIAWCIKKTPRLKNLIEFNLKSKNDITNGGSSNKLFSWLPY